MSEKIKILLVEDNPSDARLMDIHLRDAYGNNFALTVSDYLSKATEEISKNKFDIIVLDLSLPDSSGLNTFKKILEQTPETPIIVLTGLEDESVGISAMKLGAQDFLIKGKLKSKGLKRSINYSIERSKLLNELSEKTKKVEAMHALSLLNTEIILSEQTKLAEAQKLAHIGSWEWDIGTTAIHWSDEMYRIYGLEPQSIKITYEEVMKRVHPDDMKRVDSILWKGYQSLQPHNFYHRIVLEKGMVRILLVRATVVLNEKNTASKIIGTAQDITEMKQLEEALQKSKKELEAKVDERTSDLARVIKSLETEIAERTKAQKELNYEKEKLQKYLRIAKVIFLVVNKNYEVELINKKGCEITGYAGAELLRKNWIDTVIPQSHKNEVKNIFNQLLRGETESIEFYENPVVTKNGETRLIAWHNTVIKNGSGSIVEILSSGEDITEQKKAQQIIAQSEERLSNFMNSATDDFYVFDKNLNLVETNEAACKLYNVTDKKELIGKHVTELSPDVKTTGRYAQYLLVMKTGKSYKSDDFLAHARFGNRYFHVTAFRVGDGLGIISHETTLEKEYEIKLQQSEKKYRKLVENMNEGILVVNNEDVIQFVNNKFCEMTEYSEKELLGKKGVEILLEGKEKEFMLKRIQERKTGTNAQYEINLRTKSGNTHWILVSATPVLDDYGNVIGSMGIHTDISERKRYEGEIKKLSLALSKSENSILITDREGRIEWVNDGFERLTGFTLNEVKGTSGEVLRKGHKTGVSIADIHYKKLVHKKKSVSYESRNFSKSGREYWAYTTLTPILSNNGQVEKIIAVDSDITLRKKTEKELIQAKLIAEESAKSKEIFLANMSHEIRTPMNAIMGFTQLMQDTKLSHLQHQYLHSVNFAAGNLLQIINDVLDLSKISSGKLSIEEIAFKPADAINELINSFSNNVKGKKILLSAKLDKRLPRQLIGDPVRLNQVLSNLLSNAIKFTEKGSVTLRVKIIKTKKKSLTLNFEVEDTGIGIAKEKQNIIFEAFEQADANISRRYGGTGLGLAIVKQIVKILEGHISVKSSENKGTVFSVTLDFKYAEDKKTDSIKPSVEKISGTVSLEGISVLLVEDNDLNQMVASQFLKNWGIKVDIAPDGKDAVEMLPEKDYDMILMDIQMPGMNGYETTHYIREKFKGEKQKIPIMAMTAHAFKDEEKKCLDAGMDDYISKPLNRDALHDKICAIIQGKKRYRV